MSPGRFRKIREGEELYMEHDCANNKKANRAFWPFTVSLVE